MRKRTRTKCQLEGYLRLIGDIIFRAIIDYQTSPRIVTGGENQYDSAEEFLFYPGMLERFLNKYGADGTVDPEIDINPEYIRKAVKTIDFTERDKNGRSKYDVSAVFQCKDD